MLRASNLCVVQFLRLKSNFIPAALSCALLFLCGSPLSAQTNQTLMLVDVDSFTDSDIYPVGNLLPVTDGAALWQPASTTPAQIVDLNDGVHEKVLRRMQTGNDNTDFLRFPPVSNGVLTIRFDARAS